MSDTPRVGVVTFPGSLDDRDALHAIEAMGGEGVALWHADHDLREVDALVLPGGFSYGDYLRCGAIAARAPLMAEIRAFADRGVELVRAHAADGVTVSALREHLLTSRKYAVPLAEWMDAQGLTRRRGDLRFPREG